MSSTNKKPILITGSHRSGSSWTGKMISLHPSVAYINEPFNIQHTPPICKAKFDHWFTYICEENESLYLNDIDDCIHFKYPLVNALKSTCSLKDIAKLTRDYFLSLQHRAMNKRPLMKDPIALFSAEWLATTFNMDIIALIRHPAAFAGSLKLSKHTHPFNHFLEQPLLMDRHLSEFKKEIEKYATDKNNEDYVGQAILLWNIIHNMILGYKKNNPDWIFVRHEDLSVNPVDQFRNIYSRIDLDFSNSIEQKIRSFTQSGGSKGIKRDSKANRWSWKKRLTNNDIQRIKDQTYDISKEFYSDEDWDN